MGDQASERSIALLPRLSPRSNDAWHSGPPRGSCREGELGVHFLGLLGFQTYVPRTKDRVVRRGRKVNEITALFPSYIFIPIEVGWYAARFTPGLSAIVMYGDRPACVPDAVIADLHARERNGFIRLPPPPKPTEPFVAGDPCAFAPVRSSGLYGLYAGMAPRERIFLSLRMLGGERTVEPHTDDVSRI